MKEAVAAAEELHTAEDNSACTCKFIFCGWIFTSHHECKCCILMSLLGDNPPVAYSMCLITVASKPKEPSCDV
jgi:hypothetical protein